MVGEANCFLEIRDSAREGVSRYVHPMLAGPGGLRRRYKESVGPLSLEI